MTRTPTHGPIPRTASGPRQLLLVALCTLGVVVAGFAAPAAGPSPTPPDVLFGDRGVNDCNVTIDRAPVPGRNVTITVRRNGSAVTDVRVWFNDEFVGRTDDEGKVTGQVPYQRIFRIRVGIGDSSCRFRVEAPPDESPGTDGRPSLRSGVAGGVAAGTGGVRPAQFGGSDANQTGQYPMLYVIDVNVEGQPYPGERVELVATIRGDPVPDATVTVDGRAVGTTDADGTLAVRIPDDRTRYLPVRVQRGDIVGRQRIGVRLLQVRVRGSGPVAWPGQEGSVLATVGDRPVADVPVTIDGESLGRTDESGTAPVELPADPTTRVTVSTSNQTASTTLFPTYGPLVGGVSLAVLLVVVVPAVVYRNGGYAGVGALLGIAGSAVGLVVTIDLFGVQPALLLAVGLVALLVAYQVRGLRGVATLAGLAGAILAVVAAYRFGGRTAAAVTGAAVVLAALVGGVAYVRSARTGRELGAREYAGSLQGSVTSGAVRLTRNLERLLDVAATRLGDLRERIADRDVSLAASLSTLASLLRAIPGRLWAGLAGVVGLPGRVVEAIRGDDEGGDDAAVSSATSSESPAVADASIRDLWRSFARRVVPDRWRQRTPGEVSRRARERGFAAEPVEELTAVFRDVEYGNEPRSEERTERARSAFESLADDADDEEARDP